MNTVVATTSPATVIGKPIRVMVVDDAIVVRRLLTRWIGAEPDMMVAGCVRTGREAVEQLEDCNPDVVVLDVDMPELDGISALPLLLKKKPRSGRDHGFDADAAKRRNQLARAVARRCRLRSEARDRARSLDVGGVSSRAGR